MDWSQIFELIGKIATGVAALVGACWAFIKWRKQDALFPRINFEVSANFVGIQSGHVVTELVAVLENKGDVPLKIRNFSFKLRGLNRSARVEKGSDAIRQQLIFPVLLDKGDFVPASWEYSFVYPGVRTEYNFVTAIPKAIAFIRMQGDFEYSGRGNDSHHAAKILMVPRCEDEPHAAGNEAAKTGSSPNQLGLARGEELEAKRNTPRKVRPVKAGAPKPKAVRRTRANSR